jgi:hypothetical protein
MNHHVAAALASERQRELERAAGCCTPAAYYRRATRLTVGERLAARLVKAQGRSVARPPSHR